MPPIRKCFKCYGFGHIATNYLTIDLITFTEQGEAVEHMETTKEIKEIGEENCHL